MWLLIAVDMEEIDPAIREDIAKLCAILIPETANGLEIRTTLNFVQRNKVFYTWICRTLKSSPSSYHTGGKKL